MKDEEMRERAEVAEDVEEDLELADEAAEAIRGGLETVHNYLKLPPPPVSP